MSRWVVFWSFITGVLEEAKFFGISSVLEQLEEMVKVLVGKVLRLSLWLVSLAGT